MTKYSLLFFIILGAFAPSLLAKSTAETVEVDLSQPFTLEYKIPNWQQFVSVTFYPTEAPMVFRAEQTLFFQNASSPIKTSQYSSTTFLCVLSEAKLSCTGQHLADVLRQTKDFAYEFSIDLNTLTSKDVWEDDTILIGEGLFKQKAGHIEENNVVNVRFQRLKFHQTNAHTNVNFLRNHPNFSMIFENSLETYHFSDWDSDKGYDFSISKRFSPDSPVSSYKAENKFTQGCFIVDNVWICHGRSQVFRYELRADIAEMTVNRTGQLEGLGVYTISTIETYPNKTVSQFDVKCVFDLENEWLDEDGL